MLQNRDMFLSKQVYNTFRGYACAQLKKLNGGTYNGYMGEKRKKLVDKYGYDTKNASHLIRLLKMGIEILTSGKLTVYRIHDREELIEIKQGRWKFNKVKTYAEDLFNYLDHAHKISNLPDKVDFEKINSLLTDIMTLHFDIHGGRVKQFYTPVQIDDIKFDDTGFIKLKGFKNKIIKLD